MVRRVIEVVHVGVTEAGPTAFRWRDNCYVVREVLGHWRERRAWWAGAAVQALHTGAPDGLRAELKTGVVDLGEEYEVWRVEANRSGPGSVGVYDLRHDTCVRADIGAWHLLRIAD